MVKVNAFLTERLKQATQKLSKMANLVEMSSSGQLSSFTGVFRIGTLSVKEQQTLHALLEEYKNDSRETREDLKALSNITAEVKAIQAQAVLLHGERIKRAQDILKNYRDGAFTAWLIATYGNRQTPYNFLQYYELYVALPSSLHHKLDAMPRQAIYSLASREAPLAQKERIIASYDGEPKQELLERIRTTFPLSENDKRAHDSAAYCISHLNRLHRHITSPSFRPTDQQRKALLALLEEIEIAVKGS